MSFPGGKGGLAFAPVDFDLVEEPQPADMASGAPNIATNASRRLKVRKAVPSGVQGSSQAIQLLRDRTGWVQ